ncbi:MAG: cytosine permease [Lachnospiraceae bacterium]|nr:cytosine permease [Lachnospiraceae bacterium]
MGKVSNAEFIRQETITGTVPMLSKDRTYGFWDLFLITSGFSIATWCYTQGAYVAQYLSFSQMLINIFCFNIVWILVECIPIFFAVRYGIDLWVWLRSVLGIKGVAILATIISMANFGWYAVDSQLFASSMINLFDGFGIKLDQAVWKPVLGVLCVVLGTMIALGGPNVIKWVNRFLVTALLVVGAVVVIICFTAVPISSMMAVQPDTSLYESGLGRFMLSAEGNVAFAFSWSTQALVLPRLAKSEKGGYWATSLAYGVVAPFFVAAGGVMALAMFVHAGYYESDPTVMLATLAGPGFALFSLLMVAFANIGTQGTGSYVNCMIIKSGLPKISYKLLVFLAMIYVSILTVWGWVMDNFGSFISMAAQIQGPIIGMTVVDYLFVKKRKISLKSLYNIDGHKAYDFSRGFNLVGLGCLVIAFVTNILFVYNPLTAEIKSPIFMVLTGSGYTAVCGGLLYWLASLTPLRKYMLKDRDEIEIV